MKDSEKRTDAQTQALLFLQKVTVFLSSHDEQILWGSRSLFLSSHDEGFYMRIAIAVSYSNEKKP